MPNNYLSVLYKHIIQVGNKNVGLKVGGGHKHTIAPPPHPNTPPPPQPNPIIFVNKCSAKTKDNKWCVINFRIGEIQAWK